MNSTTGFFDICLGLQWGDEGKGKIVDYLAKDYNIVARFQGGPNAGHTLWYENEKIILHNLPSGILHRHVKNFIGPGCVVKPVTLLEEITLVTKTLGLSQSAMKQRIYVSEQAFVIHPMYEWLDKAIECSKGSSGVGTTGKGIGPTYAAIKNRVALRFADVMKKDFFSSQENWDFIEHCNNELSFYRDTYGYVLPTPDEITETLTNFQTSIKQLEAYVNFVDCFWLKNKLELHEKVLAEGAQGTMLDNNFGCYPMVTSSNTIAGAAPVGLGVSMKYFRKTIGVFKWYTTKVGSGLFPSRIMDEEIENLLQEAGGEIGATTGRKRMCGWLDLVQMNYAIRINDVDELIMTKVDINPLKEIQVIEKYDVHYFGKTTTFPVDLSTIREAMPGTLKQSWNFDKQNPLALGLGLYVAHIESQTRVKITHMSYGPNREDIFSF